MIRQLIYFVLIHIVLINHDLRIQMHRLGIYLFMERRDEQKSHSMCLVCTSAASTSFLVADKHLCFLTASVTFFHLFYQYRSHSAILTTLVQLLWHFLFTVVCNNDWIYRLAKEFKNETLPPTGQVWKLQLQVRIDHLLQPVKRTVGLISDNATSVFKYSLFCSLYFFHIVSFSFLFLPVQVFPLHTCCALYYLCPSCHWLRLWKHWDQQNSVVVVPDVIKTQSLRR